jgi:signal transduction histidine kinase
MQTDVTVTMAPIDHVLSEVIISDKHWLIENVLCLLSNAVKYSSEGGTVRLTTELVRLIERNEGETVMHPVERSRLPHSAGCCDEESFDSSSTSSTPVYACPSVKFSHQALAKAVAQAKMKERAISVQLAAAMEAGVRLMIRVTVEDTGIGIPDDVKPNLFQPFAQAQRFAGGTGLGLYSLAKRIDALDGANQHSYLLFRFIPNPQNCHTYQNLFVTAFLILALRRTSSSHRKVRSERQR